MLCQYERNSVLKFLETTDNYRVEYCLRLCQEYEIVDAAAFLLERVGDVGSALLLTLSRVNDKFIELEKAVESSLGDNKSYLFDSVLKMREVWNILLLNLPTRMPVCISNLTSGLSLFVGSVDKLLTVIHF